MHQRIQMRKPGSEYKIATGLKFFKQPRQSGPNSNSKTLRDHEFDQVANAVAVTPFVVVPVDQLEEFAVQFDTTAFVEDRRGLAVDEITADDFVLGVLENSFEVRLAGLLHGGSDLGVTGVFDGFHGQIDNRNGRCRDAEGHTGNLAFDFRTNERNGLRGTGGAWNDILSGGTTTFPILLARSIGARQFVVHEAFEMIL